MKKTIISAAGLASFFAIGLILFQVGCASDTGTETKTDTLQEKKELSQDDPVAKGQYLTVVAGCNDCHTPKKFGPQGPEFDTTRLLSGHPAGSPLPPIDPKALQPGHWVLFGPDLTSAVGPWGISYAANLTPDSTTGIGAWDESVFVKALRTGKHMGLETGRPILPPMPWQTIGKMNDEDLKAIFAYLKTIQSVNNRVPGPVPPNEVAAMKK